MTRTTAATWWMVRACWACSATLPQNSYPYKGPASKAESKGDFASTHVGDEGDTSPYNDTSKTTAISTQEYLRNMNVLIQWLSSTAGK